MPDQNLTDSGGPKGPETPPSGDGADSSGVRHVNIETEMKTAYLDYAMSVIVGRALPDARDGLKPAHRRILYAMYQEGLLSNRRFAKCAGVVGEVLKKYHPHGDAAVYDTLVRMAQPWNMRYPLIDGQGNFGSVDGDSAAAYRYTEARLTKLAEELLEDIEKETVNFVPNFDESTVEPTVLPSKVPNLLINGSAGIAVGMATNIPPHNLNEIVDALILLIDRPQSTIDDVCKIVIGPDFPTAAIIFSTEGIHKAYRTGRGIVPIRGKATIEPIPKKDREMIVIEEIPYQVNKAKLVEQIAELVRDHKIEGISDLRDESDREGMRVVVELKKDVVANVVLNQLYKHTPLQDSFGVNMVALVNGQPKLLNLKELLDHFILHRKEIVTRRTIFELRKAEAEAHILEGLKIALDHLDAIIDLIKKAKDPAHAKEQLVGKFALTPIQAQAILDMKLSRLTGLEREKIIEEYMKLIELIKGLKAILADEAKIYAIIKDELTDLKKRFGDARRTQIVEDNINLNVEDLIQEEDMVVTISHTGYIKRNPVTMYRRQRRGGKGVMGMGIKDEDFVENLFVASTHSAILFFTAQGRVYWLKVHELPLVSRTAKGKAIVNLLNLKQGDRVTAILPVRNYEEGKFIIQGTKRGIIKKTDLMAYSKPRPGGIIALTLDEGDELICAALTDGKQEIFIGTKLGQSIRFKEEEARAIGRASRGVKGIELGEGDEVVSMLVVDPSMENDNKHSILTISERGYSKRTEVSEYRLQGRAGSGIINLKTTDKIGNVVECQMVGTDDEIMVITDGGTLIRTSVKDIPIQGRNTQGVKTISVSEGERVVGLARIAERDADKDDAAEDDQPDDDTTDDTGDGSAQA